MGYQDRGGRIAQSTPVICLGFTRNPISMPYLSNLQAGNQEVEYVFCKSISAHCICTAI